LRVFQGGLKAGRPEYMHFGKIETVVAAVRHSRAHRD
jgi:hypothetical protein